MGTWTFTCKKHPHYRWIKTKCGAGYIGRGVLMFQGDLESRKPASPLNITESRLAAMPPEFQEHFRKRYTPECDCPYSSLVLVSQQAEPFHEVEAA